MSGQILGAKLGVAYTTQDFNLGDEYITPDGDHYMFMQADGAVTKDLLYTYDASTWQVEDQADVTNFPQDAETIPVCISPVTLADNEYAWVFVGPGSITATSDGNGVTAEAICYVSATAGTVSSTATAALLKGVHAQTTIGASTTGTILAVNRMFSEDLP